MFFGIFLSISKTTKIIPMCENVLYHECLNYRSISLIFNTLKVLEKVMYNRLDKFLWAHIFTAICILIEIQNIHAIVHLIDLIKKAVNHLILSKKLDCHEMKGSPKTYWLLIETIENNFFRCSIWIQLESNWCQM